MDWAQLAQGTDQWRDLVNMTKNIRIQRTWDFLSNCDTISFQKAAAPCCAASQPVTLASVNRTALLVAVQIAATSWQQWAVSLGFNWQRLSWQTTEQLQNHFPVSIF
jgi:hypothetical protein